MSTYLQLTIQIINVMDFRVGIEQTKNKTKTFT